MVRIYFTARKPVDFSFLHYASPSLSFFFFFHSLLFFLSTLLFGVFFILLSPLRPLRLLPRFLLLTRPRHAVLFPFSRTRRSFLSRRPPRGRLVWRARTSGTAVREDRKKRQSNERIRLRVLNERFRRDWIKRTGKRKTCA